MLAVPSLTPTITGIPAAGPAPRPRCRPQLAQRRARTARAAGTPTAARRRPAASPRPTPSRAPGASAPPRPTATGRARPTPRAATRPGSTDVRVLARQPRHRRQQPEPARPPPSSPVLPRDRRPDGLARPRRPRPASAPARPRRSRATSSSRTPSIDRTAATRPRAHQSAGDLLRAPVGAEVHRVAPPARGPAARPSSPIAAAFASVVPRSMPMTAGDAGRAAQARAAVGRRRHLLGEPEPAQRLEVGAHLAVVERRLRRHLDGGRASSVARLLEVARQARLRLAVAVRRPRPSARRRSGCRAGSRGGSGRPARWRHRPVAGLERVVGQEPPARRSPRGRRRRG